MKTKLYLLVWMCCFVLLTACKDDDPIPEPQPSYGSRTVLIYLAADNSLAEEVAMDIAEMKAGVAKLHNSGIHLLVYIDVGDSPRLVELVKKNGEVVENVLKNYAGKRNSVGVTETQEVFNDAFSTKKYQAQSYGLVYWSHGDGWIPNSLPKSRWVGQDRDSGDFMNISDLVSSLEDAPHFDFILFDACFMQSIEVAYAMRDYTDCCIGSPTEIPGSGARYDILVPAMFAEGSVSLNTATAYYTPYLEFYTGKIPMNNANWTAGVSVSVVKSSELDRLASVTNQVLPGQADNSILRTVYDYDQRSSFSSSRVGYYDMVQMMRLLTDDSDFAVWKQAYDAAVPYWATTPKNFSSFIYNVFSMEGANGASHYIPTSYGTAVNAAYRTTDWYEAAGLSKLGW